MSNANQNEPEGALRAVINTVSREKNVDKAVIIDALEQALIHAARRNHGPIADLEAHYNADTDELELLDFSSRNFLNGSGTLGAG